MRRFFQNKIFFLPAATLLFLAFSPGASADGVFCDDLFEMANVERRSRQIAELERNAVLDRVAQDKLSDMFSKNYFAHTSPEGKNPWGWFLKNGYDYSYAGENLAMGFSDSAEQHQAWMESVTHRKNILNSGFSEIGLASAEGEIGGKTAIVSVQVFASPAGAMTPAPAKPQNVPQVSGEKTQKREKVPAEVFQKEEAGFSGLILRADPLRSATATATVFLFTFSFLTAGMAFRERRLLEKEEMLIVSASDYLRALFGENDLRKKIRTMKVIKIEGG